MEEGEGGRPESSGARRFEATTATGARARVWSRVEVAGGRSEEDARKQQQQHRAGFVSDSAARSCHRSLSARCFMLASTPRFLSAFSRGSVALSPQAIRSRSIRVEREGAREGERERRSELVAAPKACPRP